MAEDVNMYEWAQKFAYDTWKKIKLSFTNDNFKIYETTITQNMVYELLELKFSNVKIFEALDETTNGNDLEVFIESFDKRYYKFAVQSKIVYKNNKYSSIKHQSKKFVTAEPTPGSLKN
jgi:RNase P/RNase MRP subunit p30